MNQDSLTSSNGRYEREDWTLFRAVRTLSQLAGVAPRLLRRLTAKEVADNGLDPGATCRVGLLPGGFWVEDDGPGIGGEPEDVARLFSFGRPLSSSKLIRRPERGALGNGLRIVAGAVFASAGRLRVTTNGRVLDLALQESGGTHVRATPCERRAGTRVEVVLGPGIPEDELCLYWAQTAIRCAGRGPIYTGKPSLHFHDSDSFFELLKAAGGRTVGQEMSNFEGGPEIAERLAERPAASLTFEEAEGLLKGARDSLAPFSPERLSLLGDAMTGSYAKARGTLQLEPGRGSVCAELPYTVETWCNKPSGDRDSVTVLVNRTPIAADVSVARTAPTEVTIYGCNLGHTIRVGCMRVGLTINVQTPYMPITSNGKEPNLEHYIGDIGITVAAAAKHFQLINQPPKPTSSSNRSAGVE